MASSRKGPRERYNADRALELALADDFEPQVLQEGLDDDRDYDH